MFCVQPFVAASMIVFPQTPASINAMTNSGCQRNRQIS